MSDSLIFAAGTFTFFLLNGGLLYSIREVRKTLIENRKSRGTGVRSESGIRGS